AAGGTGVALGAGPDLLLHRVVDALEVLGPQQLDDLARAEVVVMCGGTGRGADAAVEAAVELVVVAEIRLDVLEDRFEVRARDHRLIRERIADEGLDARAGSSHGTP